VQLRTIAFEFRDGDRKGATARTAQYPHGPGIRRQDDAEYATPLDMLSELEN